MVYKSDVPTKDGRCWYFRRYKNDINGNRHKYESKKYFTKKEAQEAEALFLLKRDNPIHKEFCLVAEDYLQFIEETKKLSTYYSYRQDYEKHIKAYFSNFYIDMINVSNINEWCLEMSENSLSVAYLNKIYNILSNIFDYAMKHYGLPSNPVKVVGRFQEKKNKVIKDEEKLRYITKEEFDKFVSVINDPLDYAFFNFAFYTGCRKGEIFALTWSDIDFKNKTISINKSLCQKLKTNEEEMITNTKNNQNRTIKMSNALFNVMKEYHSLVMNYTNYSDNWFVFGNTVYYSQTTLDRHKHKYFVDSGVREITMHEFRHSHVSLLINEYIKTSKEKNMKVDTAKFFLMMSSRMGHTIDVMQKTYMHLFPTIQDEIVDLLDNL